MQKKYSVSILSIVLYLYALVSLVIGLFQYRNTGRLLLPIISLGCALYFLLLGLVYGRGSDSGQDASSGEFNLDASEPQAEAPRQQEEIRS
jgi:uncharacterized membrane protein YeiB